ncbi:MAG TPA: ABC transporter permease [bacterium]|nr:ABC transporter permease [bacterium]
MRFEWFIAKRYLKPEGRVTFIFIIAMLSMAGVALGVASLIVVLSVMNGFGKDLREKILSGRSNLVYTANQGSLPDSPHLPKVFSEDPNVVAAAPLIESFALAQVGEQASYGGALVRGIDPTYESSVSDLDRKVIAGSLDRLRRVHSSPDSATEMIPIIEAVEPQLPGIAIGKEMAKYYFRIYLPHRASKSEEAEAMRDALGQTITLTAPPSGKDRPQGATPRVRTFEVVAVFSTGHYEFDLNWVYVSIREAQYLYDLAGRVGAYSMALKDFSEQATEETAERIDRLVEQYNRGQPGENRLDGSPITWMLMNREFFEALVYEKRVMGYILRIIILVATFNILTTLFMVGMVKTRDIGLMRSVGATRSGVLRIFLLLGLLIGAIGVFSGLGLGLAVCEFIRRVGIEMPGDGQVYYLQYLPVRVEWADVLGVIGYTFVVSLVASLFPAYWAARQQPVDSLRYE